jgi:hypothetical protein
MVGRVIGKGGETIKALQKNFGCNIQIDQSIEPMKVTVAGQPTAVESAAVAVTEIINGGNPNLGGPGGYGGKALIMLVSRVDLCGQVIEFRIKALLCPLMWMLYMYGWHVSKEKTAFSHLIMKHRWCQARQYKSGFLLLFCQRMGVVGSGKAYTCWRDQRFDYAQTLQVAGPATGAAVATAPPSTLLLAAMGPAMAATPRLSPSMAATIPMQHQPTLRCALHPSPGCCTAMLCLRLQWILFTDVRMWYVAVCVYIFSLSIRLL